jgi:hypothetical protein
VRFSAGSSKTPQKVFKAHVGFFYKRAEEENFTKELLVLVRREAGGKS